MTEINKKALYIADRCRAAGMTTAGAAGVLANVEAESAFNSMNVQDCYEGSVGNDAAYTAKVDNGSYQNFAGDQAGYGLAQWTASDRKDKMLKYFRGHGKSIGDFVTQVDYLIYDMRTFYNKKAWETCTTSDDPYRCGYDMCKYYEIPSNTEQQAKYRGGLAEKWHNFLLGASQNGFVQDKEPETPDKPKKDDEGIPIPQTWPPRTIDEHCSGWAEVWLLQSLLKCRGYNVLVDGIWGQALTDKVKQYQREHNLDPDGAVGPMSWASLLERK